MTSLKGAKKRLCGVCRHRAYYMWRSPFGLKFVRHGRVPGSSVGALKAMTNICGVCMKANPELAAKVNEVPVSRTTKKCHRCGGCGRTPSDAAGVKWKATGPGTVSCPTCNGEGRVAA